LNALCWHLCSSGARLLTLIVAVNGPGSIWLLADRRLSYQGRPPMDDARKAMILETREGTAILGYAGLGATALGTEPADWMSAVLRGRSMPLEQSLGVLADAIRAQFPRHMVQMPRGVIRPLHTVLVPAFVNDDARLYSIDLVFAPDRKSYAFRYTRHVIGATQKSQRVVIAGSGTAFLARNPKWKRSLLRVVKAYDRGSVSPRAVADHLASLNYEVHLGTHDNTVGPKCIVVWRNGKGGTHKGGGGHHFYTNTTPDANTPALPTIVTGLDMAALATLIVSNMSEGMQKGQPLTELGLNVDLARILVDPDDNLR
jgi:hypothetical protein